MTNSKHTKKALLSSVIALILCCSMLIGTTFAWFTDSVTSGKNHIVAGNLDVEVYDGNGNKIDGETDLFSGINGEDIRWEPGVVAYENLTVVNAGTLALKYQLAVNFTNENTVKGTDYKLSDVLKVAVVKGGVTATDRDALVESITNWQPMASFVEEGSLLPKDGTSTIALDEDENNTVTYGIVIYWQPREDDNNWNLYNGKETSDGADHLHIDLGINLYATQKDHESDSFGKDYDEDLVAGATYVWTLADLQKALAQGGTVVLAGDITASAEKLNTEAASIPVALAVTDGNDVVLDLNGYNITLEDTGDETTAVIFVHDADLTITGNGKITQNGTCDYVLWAKGDSTVNIESGYFYAAGEETTLLYASGNTAWDPSDAYATINVNGGTYVSEIPSDDAQDYMNVMNHGVGRIHINGGTYDFDPDWLSTTWPNGIDDAAYITISEGCKVIKSNDMYYVVPETTSSVIGSAADLENAANDIQDGGTVELMNDLELKDSVLVSSAKSEGEITINGNGSTIVSSASSADVFTWSEGGTIPAMSNVFSSSNGSKVTVNDLTFTGTMSAVMLGKYVDPTYCNYNTEFNNVNIVDAEVVSFSAGISPAACVYGTAVLNNCNIYGTTLSPLDTDPMWPVYDLALVNESKTTINGGKIGSIYTWAKVYLEINGAEVDTIVARTNMNTNDAYGIYINEGSVVNTIDLTNVTNPAKVKITIAEGAIVNSIVDNGVTYESIEAWQNAQ